MVKPIITYCCEVWGPTKLKLHLLTNNRVIEDYYDKLSYNKLALRHFKHILGVNKFTSNHAVTGELGVFPLDLFVIIHSLKYWLLIHSSDERSLIFKCLNELEANMDSEWILGIRNVLCYLGLEHVWLNKTTFSISRLFNVIKDKLENGYINWWKTQIANNNKLDFYRNVKYEFAFENYLLLPVESKIKHKYTQLRVSAHSLLIETGRYKRPKVIREERYCFHCGNNYIEDEEHFLITCSLYNKLRLDLVRNIRSITGDIGSSNSMMLKLFRDYFDWDITPLLMKFVYECFELRKETM